MNNNERFDIISLPSDGVFYPNKCSKVKLLHMNNSDDTILTAPNLYESGEMVDVLLRKKVRPMENEPFVSPDDMTDGDRLALLIFLRVTMSPIYPIFVTTSKGVEQIDFDLRTMRIKSFDEIGIMPDAEGLYSWMSPTEGVELKFRPLLGRDESEIRRTQKSLKSSLNEYDMLKLERVVVEVDGKRDKSQIKRFISEMNLLDGRKLKKHIEDIVPTLDLNIQVVSPGGETVVSFLRFTREFFFPSI